MIAFLLISILAGAPDTEKPVDVEARMAELSDDLIKNEWQWAFAWTDLSQSECPEKSGLRHQCRAFAALRDGQWKTLLGLIDQSVVLDSHDDLQLKMVAQLGMGRLAAAKASAERANLLDRVETHPLLTALDTIALRLIKNEKWKQPIPELKKLSPKHGLRKLIQ